ncbi:MULTISPECIES: acylphosphatase [unclassified Saccharicrinis]|uniref:acylphosphatase n=1 Tax=unclassified Saccharicrinis TaxID=2646859 RepID=UPI003D344427
MRRVRMIVCGRVQGVGYRYFVLAQAQEHGIKGYVRNLPGGEVEVDAEGERNNLANFILGCKKGSRMSDVQGCFIHDIPYFGFQHFNIKR